MKQLFLCCSLAAAALAAGCESTKSSNPLSPTVAGPIPGVNISAPRLLEPGQGWQLETAKQPITLLIENAGTNGVRPLFYQFEVASDANFQNKVFTQGNVPQGPNGRTSLQLPQKLAAGRTYYWRAMAQDGANQGPFASSTSFQIIVPAVIRAPGLVSPIGGALVSTRATLQIANAARSGPVGKLNYRIELAFNAAFTQMLAILTIPEAAGGRTRFGATVPGSRTIYWRVKGFDSKTSGPWSATQVFKTSGAPSGGGGGGGGGTPTNCSALTKPIDILTCHRNKYGDPFTHSEHVSFLRGSMKDFNRVGVSGGPFGLLRKESGNNCLGYSCDVVCSGQGASQRQYDVLISEDVPTWSGNKVPGSIRIDTCVAP
jgi:hypothetical protein